MSPWTDTPTAGSTRYTYRALRADGSLLIGELIAADREAAKHRLTLAGQFPVEVVAKALAPGRRRRLPARDAALGLRLLGSLLRSGISMERALGILPSIAPASWERARLEALRSAVREGAPLARALESSGLALPAHIQGMIDAGESSGTLTEVLMEAARITEESASTAAAIRSALAYPTLLAVVGVITVGLLVGIVLPRFAELLHDAGQRLPTSTLLLLGVASVVRAWWPVLLLVPLAGAALAMQRLASDRLLRQRWHERLLRFPIIGPLRHAIGGARFAATIGALLRAGLPLPRALTLGSQVIGDEALAARAASAREDVVRGERLSSSVECHAVVRSAVCQMIRAGEATGELHDMLAEAARIEAEWSLTRLRSLTRMIEPLLILCFGGLIAAVAAALLQAVYAIRPMP